MEGDINEAQLVGDGQREIYVHKYHWRLFLSSGKQMSNIQKRHHFSFTTLSQRLFTLQSMKTVSQLDLFCLKACAR